MEVVAVNKFKLSNGRRPLTRKDHRDICFGFLGGSQAYHFREYKEKEGRNTTPSTAPRRRKSRVQKTHRIQNRK